MANAFRPTAIPLITADPYFSIWSFSDKLPEDHTRHWTGKQQSVYGVLTVDGVPFRFMGKTEIFDRYYAEGDALEQTALEITPTSTVYTFSHPAADLKVTFLSPLLAARPEVFSRPVSYIFYEITPREEGHSFEVYVDFSSQLCGDAHIKNMNCFRESGHASMGNADQRVLNCCGDDVRIDWGYLHLIHPNAKISCLHNRRMIFKRGIRNRKDWEFKSNPVSYVGHPVLATSSEKLSDCFVIAYDDIHSILHYYKPVDAYYKTVYGDFDTMLKAAVAEADTLRAECLAFDRQLMEKLNRVSKEYADLGALAYRQVIAAHKAVAVDGKLFFLSKENYSNGCLATLDVTYPSIPLFLLLNPELVKGMMRPLFEFARTNVWRFDYAPHDCGCYPF